MKLNNYSFWKPYILLFPALTILVGLFLGGVTLALAQSFGYFPLLGLNNFTLKYYIKVLSSPEFLDALQYSLYISFMSSVIAVVLGVFLAYQLVKLPKEHKLVRLIYKLPIIVPHIVASLLVFLFFTQSGLVSRLLYKLDLIEQLKSFPALVFDSWGMGIILVYLWKEIPFVALVTYTVLKHINNSFSQVAANLGANRHQIFWNIYFPLSLPSIGSAFIIVFAFSFGAFEIPYLLGPTYPKTLPVMAYQSYISSDLSQRPIAMVIAITLTVICFGLIYIYKKLLDLILC
ncbi:ABC-type spermidine/putrescine transport system, permease component I [Halobacteroides halobius DSM 5150]|uniref:ABC-type spermidine/putrescine transport system, permease component I n=1 Tax=Halobacteroides halobius (strain ATCC 35273 / DSM 5150 / MD-1) TaxID=748449 RepID=L0K7X6_HALHC|nr:ABC transporter permease subunit [Halobacteroides halobius]AGB41126.1 ABC-type spermidine/putrescine transport system, permease component I [Halobacteroides halobius DSM 5150]